MDADRCTTFSGGQSGLISDSGTGTIFEAADSGLEPERLLSDMLSAKLLLNIMAISCGDERKSDIVPDDSGRPLVCAFCAAAVVVLRMCGSRLCTIMLVSSSDGRCGGSACLLTFEIIELDICSGVQAPPPPTMIHMLFLGLLHEVEQQDRILTIMQRTVAVNAARH